MQFFRIFSPTCFDILSSNFVYDFVFMYHRASLSVVIFASIFCMSLCLFVNLEYSKYTVFRAFLLHALTYWAYHRASLSVVILLQFLYELCLFVNLEYSKYTVFPRFFSYMLLTYWAEIFAYDFVFLLYYRSNSSVVNLRQFLWELYHFWNLEYWKYTVFRTFLLHPLTYWAESLHITLFFCTTDQVWVSSICVYFGVMPLFELRIL